MISAKDADAVLAGLGAAHDRIAGAMYALDQHPGLRLLRSGTLTGRTGDLQRPLVPEVDAAWAQFATLGDLLEQAKAVRGRRRLGDAEWAELARLLREPVVALGPDGLPVDGATAAGSRLGIEELARRLEKRVAALLAQLSEVDQSATAVAAALARVMGEVDTVAALATGLGSPASADPLRAAVADIERVDLSDPLVAAPAGRLADATRSRLDAVAAAAARLRQELAGLARLRDGYPGRRTALVSLVDDVAAAEAGVAAAHRLAAEKIANPGLADVPAAADVLRARLPALDRLARDARWRQLADAVSTVESSAAQARDRAGELARFAEGLLARRDELRGRLEAYRAKAAARGLAEHDGLSHRYTHAHDLLYTAPCDLRASTRAVHEYQQTLAGALGEAERSPVDAVDD